MRPPTPTTGDDGTPRREARPRRRRSAARTWLKGSIGLRSGARSTLPGTRSTRRSSVHSTTRPLAGRSASARASRRWWTRRATAARCSPGAARTRPPDDAGRAARATVERRGARQRLPVPPRARATERLVDARVGGRRGEPRARRGRRAHQGRRQPRSSCSTRSVPWKWPEARRARRLASPSPYGLRYLPSPAAAAGQGVAVERAQRGTGCCRRARAAHLGSSPTAVRTRVGLTSSFPS